MSQGVVAAGHRVTAAAATEILRAGGNAFDAIAGGFFAACIAEPVLTSLGGGGFLSICEARGHCRIYDFFCQTPRHKQAAENCDFRPILADFGDDQQEFHIGLGSVATPGAVAGLFRMHDDLGRLPMHEVMQPAIAAANEGVEVSEFQAYVLRVVSAIYADRPESRKLFSSPGGDSAQLLQAGDRFRNPALGELLEALAREGAALFYQGAIADRIIEQCSQGGHLTPEDLQRYSVIQRQPLARNFAGWQVLLNPPPASGGLLVALGLALLHDQPLDGHGPDHAGLMAAVLNATQQARVAAEAGQALSAERLLDPALIEQYRQAIAGRPTAQRGTTHISVLDADGNAAALTVSNGEGCGHILPGCGFMLNNMLGEEDLHPAGFHQWQSNQRLTSMMCPTIARHENGALLVLGSGGSNRIRSAILQVLVNLLALHMPLAEAIEAPRLHVENGLLSLEAGHQPETASSLRAAFPEQRAWSERNLFFGGVHAVKSENQQLQGHGDSRRDGASLLA